MPLFLALLLFAGCLSSDSGHTDSLLFRAGTFAYCQVDGGEACLKDGHRFELEFRDDEMRVHSGSGSLVAAMDFRTGIFTRTVGLDGAQIEEEARIEQLGPSLFATDIASRLALGTGLLAEASGDPIMIQSQIGTLVLDRGTTSTTLRIQLLREAAGTETRQAVFSHSDGIWPPQHIEWQTDSEAAPFERSYLRVGESDITGDWSHPGYVTWPMGGLTATRVPTLPPEAGLANDFPAALDAAALHPTVSAYMRAHPDWLVQEASVTRVGDDEVFIIVLSEGCSDLLAKVTFVAGVVPLVDSAAEREGCSDGDLTLNQLDEFRMVDPADLVNLVGTLGFPGVPIAEVAYHAPTPTSIGPLTQGGKRTSLESYWEVAFLETSQSGALLEHRVMASLPGDQYAFHSVAPLAGA